MNTTTNSSTKTNTYVARDHARSLASTALGRYADFIQSQITKGEQESPSPEAWRDSPSRVAWEADVALLRKMADNVPGWTHTTRLTEFLDRVSS